MGVAPMTEAGFQRLVEELAHMCGWRVYHTHDSRRSEAGWPDLALVRDGVLVLAELKTESGALRPAQAEWLADLDRVEERAPGVVRVFLWRPSDWALIQSVLGRA